MALDECDQCRFSTPGGYYCGKGLKVRDLNTFMPRPDIYGCTGYVQGTQARNYRTPALGDAPLGRPLLDHAFASYMYWLDARATMSRHNLGPLTLYVEPMTGEDSPDI